MLEVVRAPTWDSVLRVAQNKQPATFRWGSSKRVEHVCPDRAGLLVKLHNASDTVGRSKLERMVSSSDNTFCKALEFAAQKLRLPLPVPMVMATG